MILRLFKYDLHLILSFLIFISSSKLSLNISLLEFELHLFDTFQFSNLIFLKYFKDFSIFFLNR